MSTGRLVSLIAAGVTVVVALAPPVHELAREYLAIHMVQHLLLILIAAPLVALGAASQTIGHLLPVTARRTAGRAIVAIPFYAGLRDAARHPILVWSLHVAVVWAWHLPWLYELALAHEWLHALEHATFLGSAILFWSLVVRPAGRIRLGAGGGLVYVFAAAMQCTVLGALLVLADRPWYPSHVRTAGAASALIDQQLAGVLMWVPAGCVYVAAILILLGAWLGESRRRAAAALGLLLALGTFGGCRRPDQPAPPRTGDGDAKRGVAAIERHGCGACHRIPGVKGARGAVGPSLAGFASRTFVPGALRNDHANVVRWIRDPQAVEPGTIMPRLGVSDTDARDIAAYLSRLR